MSYRRMRHLKPREIQGCQLALDASIPTSLYDATSGGSLVAPDGAVARWEDQSGNGNHVTQATSGARPLRRVAQRAGLDALQFDNTDDRLINASISVALPTTIMAFGQTSEDIAVFFDSYNNSAQALFRGGVGDQNGNFAMSSGLTPATISNDTSWGGLVGTNASTGKTIQRGRVFGLTGSAATLTVSGASIGALRGNPNPIAAGYYLNGYCAEIGVWSGALNPVVRLRLNDSRSRKWRTDR